MSTLESSTAWQRAGERARPRLSLQVFERRLLLVLGDVLTLTLVSASSCAAPGWTSCPNYGTCCGAR